MLFKYIFFVEQSLFMNDIETQREEEKTVLLLENENIVIEFLF